MFSLKSSVQIAGLWACLCLLDCARFRVQELKPLVVFSTSIVSSGKANPDMKLQVLEARGLAYNLPLRPGIGENRIYMADAGRQLVRIFPDDQEEPELVLSTVRPEGMKADLPFQQLDLQIPGWISVDKEEENIYIQSYIPIPNKEATPNPPEKRLPGRQSRFLQSPSVILHLDAKRRLQAKIGREGYDSEPFALIVRIQADNEGHLNVLHKEGETLELLVFRSGNLIRRFGMPELDLGKYPRQHRIILENILPVAGKDFVIGCIAVRRKSDFGLIERVIYFQKNLQTRAQILLRNDNPRDFLIWARPQGSFYMLQAEEDGSELLFKVFSNKGEYSNNRSIRFPGLHSSWRDTFLSLDGRIFSSQVFRNIFTVYEWK